MWTEGLSTCHNDSKESQPDAVVLRVAGSVGPGIRSLEAHS